MLDPLSEDRAERERQWRRLNMAQRAVALLWLAFGLALMLESY